MRNQSEESFEESEVYKNGVSHFSFVIWRHLQ